MAIFDVTDTAFIDSVTGLTDGNYAATGNVIGAITPSGWLENWAKDEPNLRVTPADPGFLYAAQQRISFVPPNLAGMTPDRVSVQIDFDLEWDYLNRDPIARPDGAFNYFFFRVTPTNTYIGNFINWGRYSVTVDPLLDSSGIRETMTKSYIPETDSYEVTFVDTAIDPEAVTSMHFSGLAYYTASDDTIPVDLFNGVTVHNKMSLLFRFNTGFPDPTSPDVEVSWKVSNLTVQYILHEDEPPPIVDPTPEAINWNYPGTKGFETGVDRGVIFTQDGRAIPWRGLTNVEEDFGRSSESVYFDGVKLAEVPINGSFSAQVTALTYPDEFEALYGNTVLRRGVYLGEQPPEAFNFTYRTIVGNEIDGQTAGYKIHILYNVTATPQGRSYNTVSDEPDLTEFSWVFKTVPEYLVGYRPTAHIVIDTSKVSEDLVAQIEAALYGTETTAPFLPSLAFVVANILSFDNFITVIDNGDGTFTATCDVDGYINDLGSGVFEIQEAAVQWINATTYLLSSTPDQP